MARMRLRILLLLETLTTLCAGGPVAKSACPRVLRYHREGTGWTGVITIPAPKVEQILVLRVELAIPAALTTRFSGTLQLQEKRLALLARLSGGDRRPIRYLLRLPAAATVPLPRVTRITALGKDLCRAPTPTSSDIELSTTITLEHVLRPEPFRLFMQTDNPPAGNTPSSTVRAGDEEEPPNLIGRRVGVEEMLQRDDKAAITVSNVSVVCGLPTHPTPLVADGEAAALGDWPWLIAVFVATPLGLEFHCAGTLITDRHVVTAAHCVSQRTPRDLVLSAGRYNVRKWTEPQEQIREVSRIHVHPDYVSLNMTSDLAVVELSERVSFDWFVRPVCVDWEGPTDLAVVVGRVGTVVGWGRDELGRRLTPEPRAVHMPIVAQEVCLRSRPDFVSFTSERTFCAGFKNGSGPCNGDSGSGFVLKEAGRWTLRGVVSLSLLDEEHQTCDLYHYVVFTDVAKFRGWLSFIVRSPNEPQQQEMVERTPTNDAPIWHSDSEPIAKTRS